MKLEWAFFLLLIPALGCIKLSFIFFFRRVFNVKPGRGIFNLATFGVAAVIVAWTIAFWFWFLLSCAPHLAARWVSHEANNAACRTDEESDLALAISDVITDFMILLLPVPLILRLQMDLKRKLVILGIFVLGSG